MTEQIKVVVADRAALDINKLSEAERDIIFNTIAEANPDISRNHFEAFADMQTDLIKYENRQKKPGIVELLLRRLVDTSIYLSQYGQLMLVPIVRDYKIQTTFGKKVGGVVAKHVKAIRHTKLMQKAHSKEVDPRAIRARFDKTVYAVTTANRPYVIPPGEEVDVYGIKLYSLCRGLSLDSSLSYKLPNVDRFRIGAYSTRDVIMACDLIHSMDPGALPASDDMIIIEANTPAIARLDTLFDTVAQIDRYMEGVEASSYIYAQVYDALRKAKYAKSRLSDALRLVKHTGANLDPGFSNPQSKSSAEFLTFMESLLSVKFSSRYATSVVSDLWSMGAASLFHSAVLYGRDSPRVTHLTNQLKQRRSRIELQNTMRLRHIQDMYRVNVYKLIIERKLGTPRYLDVVRALQSTSADILQVLKPQERKLVELEYSKRQRYLEEVINNKCQHVKLLREFRAYKFDHRAKRKLTELRAFMDKPKSRHQDTEVIKCNNCSFNLICPHLVEYADMVFKDSPFNEIKSRMTKYIDSVVTSNYYCKICGEVIAEVDAYGSVTVDDEAAASSNISDDLKKMMYGEIIVAIKQVNFGSLVNVNKLITTIRDSIYGYIFEIEKQLLKAKTNTSEDTKNKKRLFITIYTYAYLILLMLSSKANKDKTTGERPSIDFRGMAKTTSPTDYVRYAIGLIVSTKNVIINQLPSITNDFLSKKLVEAYQNIASKGTLTIQLVGEAENLFNILGLDPLYRYIYSIWCLDKGKFSRSPEDFVDKIPTILGISHDAKDVKTDPYIGVKQLDNFKRSIDAFMQVEPVTYGKVFTARPPPVLVYDKLAKGYIGASFNLAMKRIWDRVFESHVYSEHALTKPYVEYFAECDKVLAAEKKLLGYRKMYNARGHSVFHHTTSAQFRKTDVPLGRLYDESGSPHKFDIIVYEIDGKLHDMTVKDIEKVLANGSSLHGRKVMDKKCTVCGVSQSKAQELDSEKILASLFTKGRVGNFFKFYEARCPEGGLHEFAPAGNSLICKKCTLDFDMSFDVASLKSTTFFKKYESVYDKDLKSVAESDTEATPVIKPAEDLSRFVEEYKKYAFNFNLVLDLAAKLKVNSHAIMCMAATEGREYSDVLSGAYTPAEAETRDDYRIFRLDSYIKTMLVTYNNLRFFNTFSKPPVEIARILEESGYSKHEHAKLQKILPDIYDDYQARFSWFRENKKPREIVEFLTELFAAKCLGILVGSAESRKIREAYVKYIVGKILRIDELNAKAGEFKWELLHPDDRAARDDVAYDENSDPDRGVAQDDEDDDDDKEDTDEGSTDQPLKNNFDIDYFNNPGEEPDDENADDFDAKLENSDLS